MLLVGEVHVLHQEFRIPSCCTESGPTRNTRLVVWIRNTTIPLYAVRGTPSYTMNGVHKSHPFGPTIIEDYSSIT